MSEYNEIEKLGRDHTFDPRIGNKYTRKSYVKQVYNKYFYKDVTPKIMKGEDSNVSKRKISIRSQGMNRLEMINFSGKNIGQRYYEDLGGPIGIVHY